jgi:hypothetical protein
MAHKEQIRFCRKVRKEFPSFFTNKIVIDVGSLDINGNNRRYFRNCDYTGIDIVRGENVDMIGLAHELIPKINEIKIMKYQGSYKHKIDFFFERPVSTIISTECLEHDKYWKLTLKTVYDYLRPGGLLIITCGGDGRQEHGTRDHHAWCSPGTNDYYMNLSNELFASILKPSMFDAYHLAQVNHDLQFYGIKKPYPTSTQIYQKLLKTQNETL